VRPRLIGSLVVVALLVASAGPAAAVPILISSVFIPDSPAVTLNAGDGFTYEHNLPANFNPDWDTVSSATLTLSTEGVGWGQNLTVNFNGSQVFSDSLKAGNDHPRLLRRTEVVRPAPACGRAVRSVPYTAPGRVHCRSKV
jgi:hypothetical protein